MAWLNKYNRQPNALVMALVMATAMSSSVALAKEWKEVRIAVDVPYEPFEYKKPDGTLTGFEIDLGNAVCQQANLKCDWVVQTWDGIIPGLLARKYDVIFSSMSINEERKAKVAFSEPYYNTPSAWFAVKGSSIDPAKPDTLVGKRIGVQRGTIQDTAATKQHGKTAQIVRYNTGDEVVMDLKGGRLDVVLLDFPVGESTLLKTADGEKYQLVGEKEQLGDGVGAAFRKNDNELREQFNQALKTVKDNGTYDKIMQQYFEYSVKK
ncbi:MAG: ABC transporter substrate-binding protein [Plesiomonas sp.]